MKITKQGGNGIVEIDKENKIAIKTLKNAKNQESLIRYKKEIEALKEIKSLGINNIVEVISIDEKNNRIVMKAYEGDLSEIFCKTKDNPILSCMLLKQIVIALKKLSELNIPIFHRDLKPANILYDYKEKNLQLYVSDFGCCYFTQDDNRITSDFRAVGAQSYRAPEYDYGKVECINEKGDIYSLGKILWAMINGVKNDIFPYTLWFPNEYNLCNRFGDRSEIMQTNIIIASCVSINPATRPTYDKLLEMLDNVTNKEFNINQNKQTKRQLEVKLFSAQREVKLTEIRQLNYLMLNVFYVDFNDVMNDLINHYPDLEMLREIHKTFLDMAFKNKEVYIKYKIEKDQASYIFSDSYDNIYFSIMYNPTFSRKNGTSDDEYSSISGNYNIHSTQESGVFNIRYIDKQLHIEYKDITSPYNKTVLERYIEDMIDYYIRAL